MSEPAPESDPRPRLRPSLPSRELPALELGGRSSLSFGLRARYGLGGYKPDDAPVLSGMEERKGSIWLGAGLVWNAQL